MRRQGGEFRGKVDGKRDKFFDYYNRKFYIMFYIINLDNSRMLVFLK